MSYTICIIEDDMVSQFATRYCLEQFSKDTFKILTCNNAEEALELFTDLLSKGRALPDIVFLDLEMGDMNGWSFVEHLDVLTHGMQRPEIYILSAFSNTKDRETAKNHPLIRGYFDKPLTKSRLQKVFEAKTLP